MRTMSRDDASYRAVVVTTYDDETHSITYHGPFSTPAAANNRKSLKMNERQRDIDGGHHVYWGQTRLKPVKVTGHIERSSDWESWKP